MTWQELQNQALQLPIRDRWRLVRFLLNSIQQETQWEGQLPSSQNSDEKFLAELHPLTQSLIGVIPGNAEEDSTESYVDYLEEKYR